MTRQLDRDARSPEYGSLVTSAFETIARARRDFPKFSEVLYELMKRLVAVAPEAAQSRWKESQPSTKLFLQHVRALSAAGGRWMHSPEDFEQNRLSAESLLASVSDPDIGAL